LNFLRKRSETGEVPCLWKTKEVRSLAPRTPGALHIPGHVNNRSDLIFTVLNTAGNSISPMRIEGDSGILICSSNGVHFPKLGTSRLPMVWRKRALALVLLGATGCHDTEGHSVSARISRSRPTQEIDSPVSELPIQLKIG
jgi:hypothetical protein